MLERPNIYAIFLKRWGFKDVKYDIPQPMQLASTKQKKLFMLRTRVTCGHFHERVDESPQNYKTFGTSGYPIFFFVWKLKPFEVEIPVRAISTIIITASVQLI